jgi:deoxyribonuclease-4
MSIAGGFYKAVEEAHRCGCDCVQIFTGSPSQWAVKLVSPTSPADLRSGRSLTKNNNQWRARPISDEEAEQFADVLRELSIGRPLSHSSYLINLASPAAELWQKSVEAMVVELARAEKLGIPYVVVHPGSHTTASEQEGLALVARGLDAIHKSRPKGTCQVLLEITAGQGTNLGWKFEHLADILRQTKHPERVGICFDTCHAFAAGYDLRDAKIAKHMWRSFDELLGLDRLKAIHLNDSKRELGSRVDRHEHIGRGQIGLEGFRHLLRDKRFRNVPMYLETPKEDCAGEPWDVVNLRTLRELAA